MRKKNIGEQISALNSKYASMEITDTVTACRDDESKEQVCQDMNNAQDKVKTPDIEDAGGDTNTECPVCSMEVSVNENALICDHCQEWVHTKCDPSVSKELYLEHLKNEALEFICPGCSLRRYENNDAQAPGSNVSSNVQVLTNNEKSLHPQGQLSDSIAQAQTDGNRAGNTNATTDINTPTTGITPSLPQAAPTSQNRLSNTRDVATKDLTPTVNPPINSVNPGTPVVSVSQERTNSTISEKAQTPVTGAPSPSGDGTTESSQQRVIGNDGLDPQELQTKAKDLDKKERDLKKWENDLHARSENSIKALEELSAARAKFWKLEYELKQERRARNLQEELITSLKATVGQSDPIQRVESENMKSNHSQIPPNFDPSRPPPDIHQAAALPYNPYLEMLLRGFQGDLMQIKGMMGWNKQMTDAETRPQPRPQRQRQHRRQHP